MDGCEVERKFTSVFGSETPMWWPCTAFQKSPDLTIQALLNKLGNISLFISQDHHSRYWILSTTMPRATRETQIYRKDAKVNHSLLTPAEREKLLEVREQIFMYKIY